MVYCSATGASQPEHIGFVLLWVVLLLPNKHLLARISLTPRNLIQLYAISLHGFPAFARYMDRLGIWGAGTPFPDGFASFLSYVSRRYFDQDTWIDSLLTAVRLRRVQNPRLVCNAFATCVGDSRLWKCWQWICAKWVCWPDFRACLRVVKWHTLTKKNGIVWRSLRFILRNVCVLYIGMYVARMLSFEGTSFEVVNCPLNAQLEEVRGANVQHCDIFVVTLYGCPV